MLETVAGVSFIHNRSTHPLCSRKSHRHVNVFERVQLSRSATQRRKDGKTPRTSEVVRKANIESHTIQLLSVAGLDDDRNSFIRATFSALVPNY